MNKLKEIWSNKWVRFAVTTTVYVLWFVIWSRNLWFLLGVPIIYDIYISKIMYRLFWRRHKERKVESKSYRKTTEWIETIIFAVVVASIIRTYIFSMYVIPSSSMEKSLLVGDYLYVSKVAYGPQIPNTPLSFPLVHNTMPLSRTKKSFADWWQRPYKRLAGCGNVERNDAVVFNFPEGDTVALIRPDYSYYLILKDFQDQFGEKEGREILGQQSEIITRPVDKRENYIKRAVAIPGDTINIVNSNVYINGQPQIDIPGLQHDYYVITNGTPISEKAFDEMGISNEDRVNSYSTTDNGYRLPLTAENVERIKKMSNVVDVIKYIPYDNESIFPRDTQYMWTNDDFGPLWVPKKGATVDLNIGNLPLYRRIIETYEGNKLEVKDGVIYINDKPANEYTFGMDYYFMMGDNRNRSLDSRYWGFVPEDHIVGKASFIWLSMNKDKKGLDKVRWNRIFTKVK